MPTRTNPGPCDDGDACTVNDACFGGACTGDPLDADGDGYVDAECGGDDCDDSLSAVHPGAREGPPADASCGDGTDNDCDGLTDEAELACQGGNKVVELTTEEELAPTWTDLEIALTVGTVPRKRSGSDFVCGGRGRRVCYDRGQGVGGGHVPHRRSGDRQHPDSSGDVDRRARDVPGGVEGPGRPDP